MIRKAARLTINRIDADVISRKMCQIAFRLQVLRWDVAASSDLSSEHISEKASIGKLSKLLLGIRVAPRLA